MNVTKKDWENLARYSAFKALVFGAIGGLGTALAMHGFVTAGRLLTIFDYSRNAAESFDSE